MNDSITLSPSYLSCSGVGYVRLPQSHSASMLMGMNSLAAYLQLQVVWVDLESASQ
ncbi:hypothetical protein GZ634_001458 [Vibrio cholerae]|nr:hypothetical protein [Vibrio cholerae]